MKRITTSMAVILLLSLMFVFTAPDARAARVYVENLLDSSQNNCDYEVAVWYTDTDGTQKKGAPVYLARGSSHTFDTGNKQPYMLDGSLCKQNNKNFVTGRYLMRRWIDTIPGDSNWKIEVADFSNCIFNRK